MIKIGANLIRGAAEIGRAHRFVRFLRIGGLTFVKAWLFWQILITILVSNLATERVNRLHTHRDAIGSHIGDKTGCIAAE